MPGPLEGLVVVDAAQVRSSLIAGVLLADHGAEVIKVEPPGGNYYAHELTRKGWDRGKSSVELDIDSAVDRDRIRALAATADVFFHSLEEPAAARLGLDREALQRLQPGLVVCALTAYGRNTPFAARPYGESLAAARLGAMIEKGNPHREGPFYLGHPAMHYGQAFMAVINVLAALRARDESGAGQQVEASLLDSFLAQSPMNWWQHPEKLSYMKREATASRTGTPFGHTRLVTGLAQCGDGEYLQLHTGGIGAFKRTMDLLGFGDRIRAVADPEMATPLSDDEYKIARVELYQAMKTKPRAEWLRLFHEADIAALPVLRPAEVLLDAQVEFVHQRIELDDVDFGRIFQAGPAIRFGATPGVRVTPAPAVGRDNPRLAELLARPPRAAPTPGVATPGVATPGGKPVLHALEGLKILDFSSFFATAYGGRLMSDLGADVIKVETAGGDQMRPIPEPFEACQRGKRGIVVNLKTPQGLEIVRKLVARADVVMHNWRPGKAEKAGIGYADLKGLNPRLIYAYLPGYGSTGPKAKLKSFAPLISGFCGLLYEGAGAGNPPVPSVYGNEDYNNGFLGAAAVLMAVLHRNRTGKGDYVECPQLHSSLFTTSEHFLDAERRVVYGLRMGKDQMGFSALDRLYETADGWLCIACESDARFAALARSIGDPQLAADARFATPRLRAANAAALAAILEPFFKVLAGAEAFARLDGGGAPCEIVRNTHWLPEFFNAEWAERTLRVFDQASSPRGPIREIGLLSHLAATPGVRKGAAPRLGEHTREVLEELGYGAAEIEALAAAKHIRLG